MLTNENDKYITYFKSLSAMSGVEVLGNRPGEVNARRSFPDNRYIDFTVSLDEE